VEGNVVQEGFSPSCTIGLGVEASVVIVSWCTPEARKYTLAQKLDVVDLLFGEIS
jgi:hypothetical protein